MGFDVFDETKPITGFRPLGGGIEPGETSRQAIVREMREELETEITEPKLLGVLENIFTLMGDPGHEVVFVYEAEFVDTALYDREFLDAREESGDPFRAIWRSLADFRERRIGLYPNGLLELLEEQN